MTDAEDQTEPATAKRVEQARQDGNVALSPELSATFLLAGVVAILLMRGPLEARRLGASLTLLLDAAGSLDGPAAIGGALRAAGWDMLRALFVVFAVAAAAGASATLLQTGLLINPGALLPDLARLSPARGVKRLFGLGNLATAGKSMLKLAIVGGAMWHLLRSRRDLLIAALQREPAALPGDLFGLIVSILLTAFAAQTVVAVLDITAVRLRHARSLRMSRAEVKQEAREADGNPQVKAKLRRLRALRARHRMAEAVKRATVVVTNPTHYAVALEYDRARNAAPRVVAKGMDEVAARLRALAEEYRVPIVANPPLARALHRVELDCDIPAEHYQAVAELIAYVWRLERQVRRR